MNNTLKTVVVVAELAGAAKEAGKLNEFIGYLIGAFAQANTELVKHDEPLACGILSKLASMSLAVTEKEKSTLQ